MFDISRLCFTICPIKCLGIWRWTGKIPTQHCYFVCESYSCHSYHHCHCHHNRHRCCHRHRHLHCHQYKHCCGIFIESWYFALIFIRYLEDQWISGPHPVYTWNCFGRVEDATNNDGGWNYGTTWPTKAFGSWISQQVFCGSKYALQIQTDWIFGAKMGQFFVW